LPIPAGRIQGQVAAVTDLFPTILELTGLAAPADHPVDGTRLQTLLTAAPDPDRAEQFLMHYPHGTHRSNYFTTWRDGDWKVIYHTLPDRPTTGGYIQFEGGNFELFNLAEDPFESTNLATSEPQVLQRMMHGLIAALEHHHAVYPVDDDGKELRPRLP
jgi:arylsulfatase A-like enzyme